MIIWEDSYIMNTDKYRKLKIIQMGLISLAIIVNAIVIIDQITSSANVFDILLGLCATATLFCGAIYLIFDYKKSMAGFYKAFVALYILSLLIRIISSLVNGASLLPTACSIVSLVALVALEFLKDLGQDNSSKVYAVLFVSELISALRVLFVGNMADFAKAISGLLILGTFGVMITFKYIDKKSRGSK